MSNLGLDPNRVASLDEHGHRKLLIPLDVQGIYRTRRTWIQAALILFFLILPWTRVGGHQTVLLDVVHREFALFGLVFFAHDAPLVFFLLAMATLGLAFVTSVWGRAWCGWACPQTVFIDGVYRRIETWIEGPALKRRQRAAAGQPTASLARKTLKWAAFALVSTLIAHSFAAYFIGATELVGMIGTSPTANLGYFVLIASLTAILLFDFGWFREQFCIIMCPYGRVQSVLMDRTSLAVMYDVKRGEPRRGSAPAGATGDCVDCRRCVNVCPTWIDIRQGVQMECIACTACVDACDEIMDKVKKPRGLIRYSNEAGTSWTLRKPRALIYLVLIGIALVGLTWNVVSRRDLDASLVRANDAVFQRVTAEDGTEAFVNHRRLHLKNQAERELTVRLSATDGTNALVIRTSENPVRLAPHESKTLQVFFQVPHVLMKGRDTLDAKLSLADEASGREILALPTKILGPSDGR